MDMFADLHCHPLFRAFNTLRDTPFEKDEEVYHGWTITSSNLRKANKGKRAFTFNQCDLARLTKSRTRLVFASLYPLEKGFVIGKDNLLNEIFAKFLDSLDEDDSKDEINKKLEEQIPDEASRNKIRDFLLVPLQAQKMKMSKDRIKFLQTAEYDYFKELEKEFEFYLLKNGIEFTIPKFEFNLEQQEEDVTGRYFIARNGEEVKDIIHADPDDLAFVLTIEGMHSLGIGNPEGYGHDVDLTVLKERISKIKGEGPNGWRYPVFYLTFAHHFNNSLCGHARSIPGRGKIIMDQSNNMNEGFLPNGLNVIKNLLGIDENLQDTGSRRIIIDVKHMSAKARQEYYDNIVNPYNKANPNKKIPIIASHVGYSGRNNLNELIYNSKNEKDNTSEDKFLEWNINLCDEDIKEIHKSEGLIGLSFDQRVLGIDRTILGVIPLPRRKLNGILALVRMIERVVQVPFKQSLDNPYQIWKTLTIGTDYDGFIDPVGKYSTVLNFPDFKRELGDELKKWRKDSRAGLIGSLNVNLIVEDICYRNAYEFVKKHFK